VEDQDGDGLPDRTEDPSNVEAVDPGETNPLDPDTDNDGLPDGIEDRNLNGKVDDGETDPRNVDSDADGIYDGADTAPCPRYGAPYLAVAQPSSCPAEGGVPIVFQGRNLTPDAVYWFGANKAELQFTVGSSQAVVKAPDLGQDEGQSVEVRVESADGALQARLPEPFVYTDRTKVPLYIDPVQIRRTTAGFAGEIGLRAERPPHISELEILVALEASPAAGFHWEPVREGPAWGGGALHQMPREHHLMIVVRPDWSSLQRSGDWLRIGWRFERTVPDEEGVEQAPPRIRIRTTAGFANTGQGTRLDTFTPSLALRLDEARPQRVVLEEGTR